MSFPELALLWDPAYRVIPTRFPAIGLFERVADPEDFEALYQLESLTNDRIREEVGDISLVPEDERLFGEGSTPIMAAFTHPNPEGSRFSDGRYGVFYCAHERDTAIAETRYHTSLFMAATDEPAMRLPMRLYTVKAEGSVVDLRLHAKSEPRLMDPDSYGYSQEIGRKLKAEGARGLLYPSARDPGGECLAAFCTALLRRCIHSAYLEYNWNGKSIDAVFSVTQI